MIAQMNALYRALRPLALRIAHLFGRGVLMLTDDEPGIQECQVTMLAGEVRQRVPRPQQYGFTSRPLPGAEAVVGSFGGLREHPIVLAVEDRRYRVRELEEGEVAIYSDEGDLIKLGRGRKITVVAGGSLLITSPIVVVEGDLAATGEVLDHAESDGLSMADMRAIFNTHTHPAPGGVTGVPNQQMVSGGDGPGEPIVIAGGVVVHAFVVGDFAGPVSGLYTLSLAAEVHGLGGDITVQVQAGASAPFETQVGLHSVLIAADGAITIQVSEFPDGRFAGRVLITGWA